MLVFITSTVCQKKLHILRNRTHTLGHLHHSANVRKNVEAAFKREILHATVEQHWNRSTTVCVTATKDRPIRKSVDKKLAHRNGPKANGANAQHHAVAMAHKREMLNVKKSHHLGRYFWHFCQSCFFFFSQRFCSILFLFLFLFPIYSEHKPLDEAQCLQKAGNKPATEKACSLGKICPQWHIGSWKGVSLNLNKKHINNI